MSERNNFRAEVERLMALLPDGKVTTYGDPGLPWHRLVNRFGGLAAGFHGGREAQAQLLEQDGIHCTNHIVDNFEEIRWRPEDL